jgi:flagellar motor protein MotB
VREAIESGYLTDEAKRRLKDNAAAFRACMQTVIESPDSPLKRAALQALARQFEIMADTGVSAATLSKLGPEIESLRKRYQVNPAIEARRLPQLDEILIQLRNDLNQNFKKGGSRTVAKNILQALNDELAKMPESERWWPTINIENETEKTRRIEAIKSRLDRFDERQKSGRDN